MPTGYTAAIKDDITFEQYALGCARAFGALIDMRDLPSGAPIVEEKPTTYHLDRIDEYNDTLARMRLMSEEEINAAADKEYLTNENHRLERVEANRILIEKYKDMLQKAKDYVPPSPEHKEFRAFMIEQLESSIKHDDMSEYYKEPCTKLTGHEWLHQKISAIQTSLDYHTEHYVKEVERVAKRNEWVRLLKESLNGK